MTVHLIRRNTAPVTTKRPQLEVLSQHLDLPAYFADLPHFGMAFNMNKMLLSDIDFMIRGAVSAAVKYVRSEVFEVSDDTTFNEIADAVSQLELSELTFFEAGNGRPSMIETVQHLSELREPIIELAQEALDLVEGERSTRGNLWMQEFRRVTDARVLFEPESIEEQLANPVFKVSASQRDRQRKMIVRKHNALGLPEDTLAGRIARADAYLDAQAKEGESRFKDLSPVLIAMYTQLLHANVKGMRENDHVGMNHSTDGESARETDIAPRTFVTLPGVIRFQLIEKALRNIEVWQGWQMKSVRDPDEWDTVDALCTKCSVQLKRLIESPAMQAYKPD